MSLLTTVRHFFKGWRQDNTSQLANLNHVMDMALDISGNHVMCLDLRRNRVYDLYGRALFGNNVGIDICYTYIHPDDRDGFKAFIQRLSTGQEKESECRYRWDYNYTGHGDPDWHDMHSYAVAEYEDGQPVNIIATLIDETAMLRKEREAQRLSERYRLIFEHSIVGLSFYSPDGWLIDANEIMRQICHFDSDTGDEFFSSVNLFDMPPFNEVMDRNNVEEYWACSLSIIPERDMHVYLEIRVHPVYDSDGQLVYISVAARDVTEERNMYRQVRLDEQQLQQVNDSIHHYEEELRYMMTACEMRAWRLSFSNRKLTFYKGLSTVERELTIEQLVEYFINKERARNIFGNARQVFAKPGSFLSQMRSVFDDSGEHQWNQINCIPEYDDNGQMIGAFGVVRNVSALMQKQEELRRETERANESGHMKSVFLANMTHEIRTPLNAIVGFTDVLPMLSTTEEKQEIIRVIMTNCDMLLRLINDFLIASSIDTGGIKLEPAAVDFAKSFNELSDELRLRVTDPAIEFQVDSPYETFPTVVDDQRMRQVITNFVTNSVKYTHQGYIKVGYRYEDGGLYLYCEDSGEGVSKEAQDKIFDRFYKVNDYIQGTGLGLSICKAIADACQGRIGVTSEGLGQGSTFWMWIPCESGIDEKSTLNHEK